MKKRKILLVQADTTQSLPVAKYLVKMDYEVHAIVSSKLTYGYGCRYIKKKYIFPHYQEIEKHFVFLLNILKSTKYDYMIPMADDASIVMSKYKHEFLKFTIYKLPDYITFLKGYDKHQLMEICEIYNIPHPKTLSINGINIEKDQLQSLRYPILIKPNISCGARGITYIENSEQLYEKIPSVYKEFGQCHLQEYIPAGGDQVKIQLYINENKELVQASVIKKKRWYPNKGGSSCCNVSVDNPEIVEKCFELLKHIGWYGFADFDTIEDPRTGELLIMELNPRVPACVKTAFESGINWSDVIISEYANIPHKKYKHSKEVFLRHLGFETLWFIKSKNKFKTTPSWFKFLGKNIFYQDMNGWSDPLPFIYGSLGNIIKQLSPSFRKAKSGI